MDFILALSISWLSLFGMLGLLELNFKEKVKWVDVGLITLIPSMAITIAVIMGGPYA